jgi:hypothetical protein
MKTAWAVAVALVLTPCAAWSQFAGYRTVPVTDDGIINRGASFDFATLEQGPSCIEWTATIDNSREFGAPEFNDNLRIDSTTDIASSLSVSYRSLFKAMSSSESLEGSISNDLHFREDKLTWLFRARKSKQPTTIDEKTVKLRSDVPADPAEFRQRCGDYYVAGYGAASTFYGIFELDKTAFDSDTNFHIKAEETVDAVLASGSESTEVKGELKTAFSRGQAHVIERARGSSTGKALRATDLESLITDYRNFQGDNPQPTTIILAPYPAQGHSIVSAHERAMEDNAKLWFEYRRVVDVADTALASPETFYPLLPDGQTRWNKAAIRNIRAKIVAQQDTLADTITACGQDPARCNAVRDRLAGGEAPEDYQDTLPKFLAWPDDCVTIQRAVPSAPDGEYELFYQRRSPNRYTAFCRNMAGGPTTYLKLAYFGLPDPDKQDAGRNFAQMAPDKTDHNWSGSLVMTVWHAIAIDPKSLHVIVGDVGLAQSNGGKIDFGQNHYDHANYASADQCDRNHENAGLARANIDLRGTRFRVDPERSVLKATGYWDKESHDVVGDGVTVSNGGQVVDFVSHFGYCAGTRAEPFYLAPVPSSFK